MNYSLYKEIDASLPRNHFLGLERSIAGDVVEKAGFPAATTDTASPIMATQLAPEIIPVFVRTFPLFAMLRKVPSNGLSHTWLQQTNFTQTTVPNTIAETGTVSDDVNSYMRKTTNIAVFAQRRSASLKAQFAGNASGVSSQDIFGKEVAGGILTLARDVQLEALRFQTSDPTSTTATAPNGQYDVNGFNGLRWILENETPPENTVTVDIRPTAAGVTNGVWTDQRVLRGVRQAVNAIFDKGGKVDLIVTTTLGSEALFRDQQALDRVILSNDTREIIPGLSVRTIATDQGLIPVHVIQGTAVGQWVNGTPNTFQDIMLLDTDMIEIPYLGSPEPSVIRVPMAVNGQLSEVAIPYCMYGLAALAPSISMGRVSLMIA